MRRGNPRASLALLIALASCVVLRPTDGDAAPALPGEPCPQDSPPTARSGTEKWVWSQVCVGEIADLNDQFDRDLDPHSPDGWTDQRKLSSAFLETILLYDPWRSATPRRGVRIRGAWFDETVDLVEADIDHELWLQKSRFTSDVYFTGVRAKSILSLNGSLITGTLHMEEATIGGSLFMRDGAEFKDVNLDGARVGGQLDLSGAKVTGTLSMDSVNIDRQLFMSDGAEFVDVNLNGAHIGDQLALVRAKFKDVILAGAHVGGQVDLRGAKVSGKLDMDLANIDGHLFMSDLAEFKDVILSGARIGGQLDMSDVKVTGKLDMYSANIIARLSMGASSEFSDIDLSYAQIGGSLNMTGANYTGSIDMNSINIDGDLFANKDTQFAGVILLAAKIKSWVMLNKTTIADKLDMNASEIVGQLQMAGGATFSDVDLSRAEIGDQIDFRGSNVTGSLDLGSATIGADLYMGEDAEFKEVILRGAHVGDRLDLSGAKVTGKLDMDSASIGTDLFMRDGQFFETVNLTFAKVGNDLDVRGAALAGLDLTEVRIDGGLRLASVLGAPTWADSAVLSLYDARVATLQDEPEAKVWPQQTELNGFTYECLGGVDASSEAAVGKRGSKWFVEWLARDKSYTPQPYQQASKVLRAMGQPEMADDVLYAGRERERREAWEGDDKLRWLGLSLLNWTIGYGIGHRVFWALFWVVGLVLIGTLVLRVTGQSPRDGGKRIGIWYSFDTLLPVVELRQAHYDIDLEGFARYWFYVHKLMGYVLVSFLIAGLSGLTS